MKISVKSAACLAFVCSSLSSNVEASRVKVESFAPIIPQRFVSAISKMFHHQPVAGGVAYNTFRQESVEDEDQASIASSSAFPYLTTASSKPAIEIATEFVKEKIGDVKYVVKNVYTSKNNGVTHVYLRQIVDDLEVENGDVNINVDKLGRVLSYGDSFYHGKSPSQISISEPSISDQLIFRPHNPLPQISAADAVRILAEHLKVPVPDQSHVLIKPAIGGHGITHGSNDVVVLGYGFTVSNGIPVTKKYITRENKNGELFLELVWDVQAEMEDNWFHAHVSAHSGQVLGLLDWVSEASYNVYPLGINDPADGDRKLVVDPADKDASPFGWHAQSDTDTDKMWTTTMGNNVYAQENVDGQDNDGYLKNYRPDGNSTLDFDFALDLKQDPKTYLDAAVTNLFYWNNIMHDLFYKYGFDEDSGNFQENNLDRGGRGGDAVIANAQDGAGYNNANFATPPDGQHGKMRMYVWNTATPFRDGDLENGIIIHEYTHGISTRLTGGPSNSGCLGWGESGGMGEGYGDYFATVLRQRANNTREMDFAMGVYAVGGDPKGIRKFVYSTSMTTNPSTYAYIRKFSYNGVHAKGEVWAAMLYELYWNLVEKHGFSANLFTPKDDKPAGNVIALQLVIDGMKMQPCRPSFVDARDAIIQADEANYGGENVCEIWKAFAKRGLGLSARKGGRESFEVPTECQ